MKFGKIIIIRSNNFDYYTCNCLRINQYHTLICQLLCNEYKHLHISKGLKNSDYQDVFLILALALNLYFELFYHIKYAFKILLMH